MRSLTIIFFIILLLIVPSWVFAGRALDNYLWVPNYYDNTVSKVDVNSHTVVATIPVGTKPSGIAVGFDYVYVTCRRSSCLYRISKATSTVHDSIDLSEVMELPIGVAVDSSGYAFVVGREHFDASSPDLAYLVKVNPQGLLDKSVSLLDIDIEPEDGSMRGIGIGLNNKVNGFVPWRRAYWMETGIIQFDTDDLSFMNHPISYHYYRAPGVGIDKEGNMWSIGTRNVANFTKLVPEVGLTHYEMPAGWGQRRGGVVVDPQNAVWASTAAGLFKLVPKTEQVYQFEVGVAGGGIACDINGYIWASFPDSNKVKKFDLSGNQVGASVEVGNYPLGYGDMTGYETPPSVFSTDSIPFTPPVNYEAGDGPVYVFCADLDGDGDLDLAVANSLSDNVSILKNNGDGTFQTRVDYDVNDQPYSVFCADLDGDLDLDLAVANSLSDNVSILKNNGDGTFQAKVDYAVGDYPFPLYCADLDGDLDIDLAVPNQFDGTVSILKNNGDGTFATKVDYDVGSYPNGVFCADLDGDSCLDLAVHNYLSDNVSILMNNGDGTFQNAVNYGVGNGPRSLFGADVDGDSDIDLVVTNAFDDNVSVLKNNGNGTFQTKVDYSAGNYPNGVFCADLDGDSDLDLAMANINGNNVSVLKNHGDGSFHGPIYYLAGDSPWAVRCADLDGDGDPDLAVANGHGDDVSVLLNLSNSAPYPFSLEWPQNLDSLQTPVDFDWHATTDPDDHDTIRYCLHISESQVFNPDSTVTHDSLRQSLFRDSLDVGVYYWKVKAYDTWGAVTWSNETWSFCVQTGTGVADENQGHGSPAAFTLLQNYPNPFNQSTKIRFNLPRASFVSLNIYDLLGRKVRILVSEHLSPGFKSVLWDARNDSEEEVASGIYFYQIKAGDFTDTKKLVLVK